MEYGTNNCDKTAGEHPSRSKQKQRGQEKQEKRGIARNGYVGWAQRKAGWRSKMMITLLTFLRQQGLVPGVRESVVGGGGGNQRSYHARATSPPLKTAYYAGSSPQAKRETPATPQPTITVMYLRCRSFPVWRHSVLSCPVFPPTSIRPNLGFHHRTPDTGSNIGPPDLPPPPPVGQDGKKTKQIVYNIRTAFAGSVTVAMIAWGVGSCLTLSEVWSAISKAPLSTSLYVVPPFPLLSPGASGGGGVGSVSAVSLFFPPRAAAFASAAAAARGTAAAPPFGGLLLVPWRFSSSVPCGPRGV